MFQHDNGQRRHQTRRLRTVSLAALILLLLATPLFAEDDEVKKQKDNGFFLGLRLFGSSLHVDDEMDSDFFIKDDGGGAYLNFGYSFNSVFSLELSLGGAAHETSDPRIDATFGMFQIFAKYHFAPGHDFRPYIKGGLGGYELRLEENNVTAGIEGGGLAFGGGFDYFFTPHFSLGMDITHNVINYEEFNFAAGGFSVGMEIDEEGAMTSLGLNLTFHF
ncbi:MAG: outer membrane beta-barrel protein [Candidatus Latescibacterota bacterium]